MAPQQKGKQGTKGAKQINEENVATLIFYRNMSLGSSAAFFAISFIFFEISTLMVIMSLFSVTLLFSSYQFMCFICRTRVSDTGAVLDTGADLNMEGGIAEHVKDLIILTSGTLLLSLLTNYFWLLLILAPTRACWLFWQHFIKPSFAQKSEEPEVDEKKQKKLERKMKRMR